MVRNRRDDVSHRCLFLVNSHDMTNHLFCQLQIDLAVGECRVGQQGCKYTLEVSYGLAHVLRDEVDHIVVEHDTVATHLSEQDVSTQLIIRPFNFGRQTPFETGEQSFFDVLEFNRRTVGSENELFAALL